MTRHRSRPLSSFAEAKVARVNDPLCFTVHEAASIMNTTLHRDECGARDAPDETMAT